MAHRVTIVNPGPKAAAGSTMAKKKSSKKTSPATAARKTAKRVAKKVAKKTAKTAATKQARKTAKTTAKRTARKTAKTTAKRTARKTAERVALSEARKACKKVEKKLKKASKNPEENPTFRRDPKTGQLVDVKTGEVMRGSLAERKKERETQRRATRQAVSASKKAAREAAKAAKAAAKAAETAKPAGAKDAARAMKKALKAAEKAAEWAQKCSKVGSMDLKEATKCAKKADEWQTKSLEAMQETVEAAKREPAPAKKKPAKKKAAKKATKKPAKKKAAKKATKKPAKKKAAKKPAKRRRAVAPPAERESGWPSKLDRYLPVLSDDEVLDKALVKLSRAGRRLKGRQPELYTKRGTRRKSPPPVKPATARGARRMQLAGHGYLQLNPGEAHDHMRSPIPNPVHPIKGFPGMYELESAQTGRTYGVAVGKMPESTRSKGKGIRGRKKPGKKSKQMTAGERKRLLNKITRI